MPLTILRPAMLALGVMFAVGLSPAFAQPLAITGATIIDGTGKAPVANGVIVIDGARIAAVGPARSVPIPAGAQKIDAQGKYVIPGLMDAIVLLYTPDVQSLVEYEGRHHEIVLETAQLALKNGITTVFDTNRPPEMLLKARELIDAGAPGSRIYFGGHIIGMDGPLSADFSGGGAAPYLSKAFVQRTNEYWEGGVGRRLMWMTPDEVRPVIRGYIGKKVDFLKYAANDHMPGAFIGFSPRVQKAIVEEGHRAGITVQAHVMSIEGTNLAIEAGLDILTHGDMSGPGTPYPQDVIRKMLEYKVSPSVLPVTERNLQEREKNSPDYWFTKFVRTAKTNRRNMIKAGVPLILATETMVRAKNAANRSPGLAALAVETEPSLHGGQFGEDQFNALVALEEEGMALMEVLRTATANPARAYKLDANLGTLERGKLADLLILDADPLASARNYASLRTVIKDGKVIDRDALPTNPIITR